LLSAAILSFKPSNQRTRRNSRLTSHFHQAWNIRCLSEHRHCPCNTTRANNLLEWALREILGAPPLREEHIKGDNRELFSMPVGARPSIEEIRTVHATWYSSATKKMWRVAGGVGMGLLHRVILGSDGLGADITRPQLDIFLSRIALPTALNKALKYAHQPYPAERRRPPNQSVHNRLNATAQQIALQKLAFWDWISSDKSYSQRKKLLPV
jgi:hypothetical protein